MKLKAEYSNIGIFYGTFGEFEYKQQTFDGFLDENLLSE